ncbi:MAG: hypothetical protein Q9203_004240 [Teloschistes exilis]
MTDKLIPVNNDEVQGRVTQQDEQLERGVAILLFVDRALETWFQPQFEADLHSVHASGLDETTLCHFFALTRTSTRARNVYRCDDYLFEKPDHLVLGHPDSGGLFEKSVLEDMPALVEWLRDSNPIAIARESRDNRVLCFFPMNGGGELGMLKAPEGCPTADRRPPNMLMSVEGPIRSQ